MASFTGEYDDCVEYASEYDQYTCDSEGLAELTRDMNNMTLPPQDAQDEEKYVATAETKVSTRPRDRLLPITYELMVLVNNTKFAGRLVRNVFDVHDFAARPSRQVAKGGYFQTREVSGLGVAKYPLLPTASTKLSVRSYKALANELRVLSHVPLMGHENIVKIKTIGWTRLDPAELMWMPMVFLEFAELGTLTHYLSDNRVGVDIYLELAQDVGRGLQALHACGIMHGDLKSDNVLMFRQEDGEVKAKLSDFGCSIIWSDIKDEETASISAGTKPWNSPELGKPVQRTLLSNVDTYAFGLLVWRIFLNGRNPFEGLEDEDIEERKLQDLMISDASLSLEDDYDKKMLLRGTLSSHDRTHLYLRGVAMPKSCFRYTLSLNIQARSLEKAMERLSFNRLYGTSDSSPPILDQRRLEDPSLSVEFLRLFDTPRTVRTMFFQSIEQVAVDETIPRETRANAYLQLCYAYIDSFGTEQNITEALDCIKKAAGLGSHPASSILRRLFEATGEEVTASLESSLKQWLGEAVGAGSLLARQDLRHRDENLVKEVEKSFRLFMGAKSETEDGVASADIVETVFLPANLAVTKILLGANQKSAMMGFETLGMFMSSFQNNYLHAGAALGVDPDHFNSVVSIAAPASINAQDDNGNTPLILALRFANRDMARILLENGASPSLANKRGETPWHWLISVEPAEVIKDLEELIQLMCNDLSGLNTVAGPLNSPDNQYSIVHGGTPLHWAVDMRAEGVASVLLTYGADPLLKYRGLSPIDLAVQYSAPALLEIFLDSIHENGLDLSPTNYLLASDDVAGKESALDGVELGDTLFVRATASRPLHERFVYGGDTWLDDLRETLEVLHENCYLASWTEENTQSRLSSLRMAAFAETSGTEILEMMDNEGYLFPNTTESSEIETVNRETVVKFWRESLRDLVSTSRPAVIHLIIDKIRGYSSSARLDDPDHLIHSCCSSLNADVSVVESILRDCLDVDCLDDEGRTPLMNALRNRNFDIATYLLSRGADLRKTWVHNGQKVHIIYEFIVNNVDIDLVPLKYLLEPAHPFLDKTPPFIVIHGTKSTALHIACQDGNPVIVDYLLSRFGATEHLDAPDDSGFTALHHAAFNGHAELVMKLCRAGAEINARSGPRSIPGRDRSRPLDLCFRWWTQDDDYLALKYGLERTREDVYLGRLRIAEYLVRRHQARRASRLLVHRSLARKLALGAAEKGMTRLLAEALRLIRKQLDSSSHGDADYSLLLDNLLWVAAIGGRVGAARLLLNLGADVERRSHAGLALIHAVAWQGHAEMVYVLVRSGRADINAEDAEGQTVLTYAVKANDLATVRMVKSLGGLFTITRAQAMESLRREGLDPTMLPPGFKVHYHVRFQGEPSDEELSNDRSDESEVDEDGEDGDGVDGEEIEDNGSGEYATEDKDHHEDPLQHENNSGNVVKTITQAKVAP